MPAPNEMMSRSWKGNSRISVENWRNSGLTRYEYMFKNLEGAIVVDYDPKDINHQGDVRYRELASEGTRWQDTLPLVPLHVRELQRGRQYEFRQLPLGSSYSLPSDPRRVLQIDYYNYYPQPSKGTNIDTAIGDISFKGRFTDLAKMIVIFKDHPNKKFFDLATKSAASTRARSPSPQKKRSASRSSMYKKKAAFRQKQVQSAKKKRTRKLGSRAKSVSVDKLRTKRSTTRRTK